MLQTRSITLCRCCHCAAPTGQAELWAVAPEALECCEDPDDTCREEEGMKERDALEWYNGQWEEAPGWAARRAALQRLQDLVWGQVAAGAGSQATGSQSGQEPGEAQRRGDPGREGHERDHVDDGQLPNDGDREWRLRAALRLADALGVGQRFRRGVRVHEAATPGVGAVPNVGAAPASGVRQSPLQGGQGQGGGLGTQGEARRTGLSGQGEAQRGLELQFEYGGEIYGWDQPLRVGGPCDVLARYHVSCALPRIALLQQRSGCLVVCPWWFGGCTATTGPAVYPAPGKRPAALASLALPPCYHSVHAASTRGWTLAWRLTFPGKQLPA